MRQSLLLLGLLILMVWTANPQNALKTGLYVNGRWWKSLPDLGKEAYLTAAMEGVADLELDSDAFCSCRAIFLVRSYKALAPENSTYGEIIGVMDAFYKEPTNMGIPVLAALKYAVRKVDGASRAALDRCEAELRKNVTEPVHHTSCSP